MGEIGGAWHEQDNDGALTNQRELDTCQGHRQPNMVWAQTLVSGR